MIWASTRRWTFGLIVRDRRTVDGPPIARKMGLVGIDARAAWDLLADTHGAEVRWLP